MAKSTTTDTGAVTAAFPGTVVEGDMHPIVKLMMEDPTYTEAGDAFSMLSRKFEAQTPEELLSPNGEELTPIEDNLNRPFMLHDVSFRPGDKNPEVPVWAIFDVTFSGSEDHVLVHVSGLDPMVTAKILKDRGWLPRMVMVTQSTTKSNREVYNLVTPKVNEAGEAEPF